MNLSSWVATAQTRRVLGPARTHITSTVITTMVCQCFFYSRLLLTPIDNEDDYVPPPTINNRYNRDPYTLRRAIPLQGRRIEPKVSPLPLDQPLLQQLLALPHPRQRHDDISFEEVVLGANRDIGVPAPLPPLPTEGDFELRNEVLPPLLYPEDDDEELPLHIIESRFNREPSWMDAETNDVEDNELSEFVDSVIGYRG